MSYEDCKKSESGKKDGDKNFVTILFVFLNNRFFFSFSYILLFVKLSETKLSIYVTQKNF
ncbi:hypothetical protein FIU39_14025 [Enterococcus faecium]|nr:hypothetical protein FIU39_14025 [Enterococcus faecium]